MNFSFWASNRWRIQIENPKGPKWESKCHACSWEIGGYFYSLKARELQWSGCSSVRPSVLTNPRPDCVALRSVHPTPLHSTPFLLNRTASIVWRKNIPLCEDFSCVSLLLMCGCCVAVAERNMVLHANMSLSIEGIRPGQFGVYICSATNSVGFDSATTTVQTVGEFLPVLENMQFSFPYLTYLFRSLILSLGRKNVSIQKRDVSQFLWRNAGQIDIPRVVFRSSGDKRPALRHRGRGGRHCRSAVSRSGQGHASDHVVQGHGSRSEGRAAAARG